MQQLEEFQLFTSIIGVPVGIASASFTLIFSLTTGIVEKLLNITRKKRKKKEKDIWNDERQFKKWNGESNEIMRFISMVKSKI